MLNLRHGLGRDPGVQLLLFRIGAGVIERRQLFIREGGEAATDLRDHLDTRLARFATEGLEEA